MYEYNKTVWSNGDIIDAEKLNHAENGIFASIRKDSFQDAGIKSESFTTVLADTETTTEDNGYQIKPVGKLSDTEKIILHGNIYRVTIDNETYILPCYRWFIPTKSNGWSKMFVFIGNLNYWGNISGYVGNLYNVPFLITDSQDHENSWDEGLYIYTNEEKTVSVKIELIEYAKDKIPDMLIYKSDTVPVEMYESSSTYNSYSIGCNSLKNKRGTFAFGCINSIEGQFSGAFGYSNVVTGQKSFAVGNVNIVSGSNAYAFGQECQATEWYSQAFGYQTKANGMVSSAEGLRTQADGQTSKTIGTLTKSTHRSQFVFGEANEVDPSENEADKRGTYVEIVGNGSADDDRSNARTLDWEGNESLAGGITLGKGTVDEVSISAAQLKQLLALLNN